MRGKGVSDARPNTAKAMDCDTSPTRRRRLGIAGRRLCACQVPA
jgi:hypothetical protein